MKVGVVSAFFDILGGVLGSWAASHFYLALLRFFPDDPSRCYVLIFAGAAGTCVGTGIWLSHRLEAHFLGLTDKFFGALLGLVLSLTLATSALFPFLMGRSPAALDMFHRAAFAPYVMRLSQKCFRVAPPELWALLDPLLEPDGVFRARLRLESSR